MAKIIKLTGFMGAELSGLDLREPISDDLAEMLRTALARHHMIVVRDQHLSLDQQKRVTMVFGRLVKLPYVAPIEGDDEVIAVVKDADERNTGVFGGEWHSDFSFLENPPAGSVLNAIEIPDVGGDTVWSSQVAAYRALPDYLKALLADHNGIHVGKPYGVKFAPPVKDQANARMTRGDPNADRETVHPSVLTEPTTGAKALFLNPIYTSRFEGMTETESQPFLEQIYRHAIRPDFCCRHKWRVGDVVIWDNRMTMHYATNDYEGSRRMLYRTTFERDRPA